MILRKAALVLAWLVLLTLAACRAPVDGRPEARCYAACRERASARCNDHECARGCRFVIDRIVEREDPTVIACVAEAKAPCGDETWANCAARVGLHIDGGPPVPAPLPEIRDEDEAAEKVDPDNDLEDDDDKKPASDAGVKAPPAKTPAAKTPPAKTPPAKTPAVKPPTKPKGKDVGK